MTIFLLKKGKNHQFPSGHEAGFTLFETVISIGLLLVVVASFGGFVASLINTHSKLQSVHEVQGNARLALDVIARLIRSARDVNDASSVWGTDPGVLSLSVVDPTKNPTVIRLDQDDGMLTIQEGASAPVALTSSSVRITALQFTRYAHPEGDGTIGIRLTLSSTSQSDAYVSYTDTYQTAISLR